MYDAANASDDSALFEFISLVAGQQSFCIELNRIREIRRWEPVTMLPHSPDFVKEAPRVKEDASNSAIRGVISIDEDMIRVIDLEALMNLEGGGLVNE